MRFRGGEFSTGTMGNFQPELTRSDRNILGTLDACFKSFICNTYESPPQMLQTKDLQLV